MLSAKEEKKMGRGKVGGLHAEGVGRLGAWGKNAPDGGVSGQKGCWTQRAGCPPSTVTLEVGFRCVSWQDTKRGPYQAVSPKVLTWSPHEKELKKSNLWGTERSLDQRLLEP